MVGILRSIRMCLVSEGNSENFESQLNKSSFNINCDTSIHSIKREGNTLTSSDDKKRKSRIEVHAQDVFCSLKKEDNLTVEQLIESIDPNNNKD